MSNESNGSGPTLADIENAPAPEEFDAVEAMLPNWVEFSRLGNKKEMADAVQKFFANEAATVGMFYERFGVDLTKFQGYYLETGVADAPQGPLTPTRVTPILVLRASQSGDSYSAHIFKHDGLMHDSRRLAWIDREAWDKLVDDTFAEELKKRAAKLRESKKRAAEMLAAEQDEDTDEKNDAEKEE